MVFPGSTSWSGVVSDDASRAIRTRYTVPVGWRGVLRDLRAIVEPDNYALSGGALAVGGVFLDSTNGLAWNTTYDPPGTDIGTSVCYMNGIYIAVGRQASVYRSLDGITWQIVLNIAPDLFSVCAGQGIFVAVGQNGTVITSPDGLAWTTQVPVATGTLWSVAYSSTLNLFIATGGYGATIIASPDGVTWTVQVNGIATNQWYSITFGAGLFVAVGISGVANRVATSPDGVTWTMRTPAADNPWLSVTYGAGLFVAVSDAGAGNRVMTSPDGITWTIRSSAADNAWGSVTYGGGLFVAVASTGVANRVMTSPDGITWTIRTSAADNSWQCVTYGAGLFVAVASDATTNLVMTSPNGVTWTPRISAYPATWRGIVFAASKFVAIADTGAESMVMISLDGIGWASVALVVYTVTSHMAGFVAGGMAGAIYNTSNGVSWVPVPRVTGPTPTVFQASASNGNVVVIAGTSGLIFMASGIATTWAQVADFIPDIYGIAWSGTQFIAVGNTGFVATSPDGTTWTLGNSGVTEPLFGVVAWGNPQQQDPFVVIKNAARIGQEQSFPLGQFLSPGGPNRAGTQRAPLILNWLVKGGDTLEIYLDYQRNNFRGVAKFRFDLYFPPVEGAR